MTRKRLPGILALLMALGLILTACGQAPAATDAATQTPTATPAQTETAQAATSAPATEAPAATASATTAVLTGADGTTDKTPITFTLYNADGIKDDPFNDDIAKEITKYTGVTIKMSYPVNGQSSNTIATMIASGELPDFIYAKGDTSKLYDAGYLVKLDDMIEKEGPNIKALYGDYLRRLKYSAEDPHFYHFGPYGVGPTTNWGATGPMQIQNAVLKDLGYPQMKTLADYEKAIKDYIAKYPEINGAKTIGMSLLADDWRWLISLGNPAGFAAGYPDNGQWIVSDQGDATYKFLDTNIRAYFKWLNGMNAQGLLDPDSFTQKYDQYLAKLSSGRVLAIADAGWEYSQADTALVQAGMTERTYAPMPITVNDTLKIGTTRDGGYSGGPGVAITTSCKNPERAFQYVEWLASDTAQILNYWGIEGKHYDIVDGKRVRKPEIVKQSLTDPNFSYTTGIGLHNYPFPQRGDGVVDPTGNNYTVNTQDSIIENYNASAKETLAGYGVKAWNELLPKASEFPVSPYGAAWLISIPSGGELDVTVKNADTYCQGALAQAVMVKPEKFDAAYDKIIADLKQMGIEQANADMSKLIKDRIAFWK